MIAGNGYAFVKFFEHSRDIFKNHDWPSGTLAVIAMPMLGIAAAYLALAINPVSRAAQIFEWISAAIIGFMMLGFLVVAITQLGLLK